MRVRIWPAGTHDDATSQYRLYMPAAVLAANGADVIIDNTGPILQWDQEWHASEPPPWVNIVGLAHTPDAEVVVIQRPGRRWWADTIPHLQARGIRVVVDVDDMFDKIDDGNIAKAMYDTGSTYMHSHHWISEACRLADVVTCTTPALLKRYGFGHGVLLPNYVPERYLSIEGSRPATIGWSGHVGTHPKDLQATGGAVETALRDGRWGFHTIGTGNGVREALGLSEDPTTTDGWVPFAEYAEEMAKLEIGIVPLAGTAFNAAKSALKMAEFAAVGVPVVASPTPDNQRLHDLGVGLLATNPQQWKKKLLALTRNPEFRLDLAGRGREVMATQTYERNAERWHEAWTGVRRPARQKVTAG